MNIRKNELNSFNEISSVVSSFENELNKYFKEVESLKKELAEKEHSLNKDIANDDNAQEKIKQTEKEIKKIKSQIASLEKKNRKGK